MKKKNKLVGLLLATITAATFTACGTPTYVVNYETNNGSVIEAVSVKEGDKLSAPSTTKEGYTFEGWYLDAACTVVYDFDKAVTSNMTLYSKWAPIEYTVTFDTNGGSTVDAVKASYSGKVTQPVAPTKAGSLFEGWYSDAACTTAYDFDKAVTGNMTLYAKWSEHAVTMNQKAYDSVAEAFAAIPTSGDTSTYTIYLNKGVYAENGLVYNGSATVKICGVTSEKYGSDVVIKGRGSDMTTEKTRDLIEIQGTGDIILENVTLESDYSRETVGNNAQAEVLGTDTTGHTVAYNCSFKSHQDTLRTAGKAWFYGCYIEGDVDFIWMESAGSVALYEECEIVSVYDSYATTHASYLTAPRMEVSSKVGKGLVIYHSTVKESEEAKANGETTYLARTPWASGYYNQVAYIDTTCTDVEVTPWYKTPIATEYARTVIGWKMDQKTADSMGYTGSDDIVDADTVAKEFGGRKAILNRLYNTVKGKYEKDTANAWDIDAVIKDNGWTVKADTSSDTLEGEVVGQTTTYVFDGTVDQSALCNGFAQEAGKAHYKGAAGDTITIPVTGKSVVEVYGYYAGTLEAKADTQPESILFFNNGSTNSRVEQDYIVYDANAKSVVLTAKAATYITKIVVTTDPTLEKTNVSSIAVTGSTEIYCVGVALNLTAQVNPVNASNKSVTWSSSDTSIADVDAYSGVVTFKTAGEVTFTATACDGSGVTGTLTCTAKEASWTAAEWYTTDQTLAEEAGAIEIGNFSCGSSAYKALAAEATFVNLSGETITTKCGLKLNSSGAMSVSTTKDATLTIVIGNGSKSLSTVAVTGTGVGTVELVSKSEGDYPTYVFRLTGADTWTIKREATSGENNPIVYAKVEYDK